MTQRRLRIRAFLLIGLLALIHGCTMPMVSEAPTAEEALRQQQIRLADSQVAAGDYAGAAELYLKLASEAPAPTRQALLLKAADARLQGGHPLAATSLLAGIEGQGLPPELRLHKRLLEAEIALGDGRIDAALELLQRAPPTDTPRALQERFLRDDANALRRAGNPLESARRLSELDTLLSDPQQRLANQMLLVETLNGLTNKAIEVLLPQESEPMAGWEELAVILRELDQDPAAARAALERWRASHPGHPVLPDLVDNYLKAQQALRQKYRRIAILLPQGGRYAPAAAALADGFLAAYYRQPPEQRPTLRFYDSQDPETIWPLYQQAIAEGAQMLVGPLQKEAVAQLLHAGELEIPVLALNRVPTETQPPANLFQFALAPEDEAQQVAQYARDHEHRVALALIPKGGQGERAYNSFRDSFESRGGIVAERQDYAPQENDFSTPIQQLLNLDESKARRKALQRQMRRNLEFEPRRRQDADFIFLVAGPQKARELWPQLRFYRAGTLPVFTTSRIYSGHFDAARDQDLEGLVFPDIPWLLEPGDGAVLSRANLTPILPRSAGGYARLFAMGIDSYRLLPWLERMRDNPAIRFEGRTGFISLDAIRRLHRQLLWARMTADGPRLLGADRDGDSAGREPAIPGPVTSTAAQPDLVPIDASRIPAPPASDDSNRKRTPADVQNR